MMWRTTMTAGWHESTRAVFSTIKFRSVVGRAPSAIPSVDSCERGIQSTPPRG